MGLRLGRLVRSDVRRVGRARAVRHHHNVKRRRRVVIPAKAVPPARVVMAVVFALLLGRGVGLGLGAELGQHLFGTYSQFCVLVESASGFASQLSTNGLVMICLNVAS